MRGTKLLISIIVFWAALSAACTGTTPSSYTGPSSGSDALTSYDEPAANADTASASRRSERGPATPVPPPSQPQASRFAPPPSTGQAATAPPAAAPPGAQAESVSPPSPEPASAPRDFASAAPPPVAKGAPAHARVNRSAEASDDQAPAAAPSQPSRAEAAAPLPTPRERPGLGTQWGETRESHVRDVTFLRGEPNRPFALAKIYYNDRAGIDALAAYRGGRPLLPLELNVADGAVTVCLIDKDSGTPLDAMRVGDRPYVVGEEGHRYGIRLENHTSRRLEAVATVDGLDVVNGRSGGYDNRGYVLGPWETLDIDGFRRSQDEVAAFRFSRVSESYAAQRGSARNVGVIGVAFFGERGDDWSSNELRIRDTAQPFPREGRFAPPPPLGPAPW